MIEKPPKKEHARHIVITGQDAGRRIDNYLIGCFGKFPRTRVYRMLRKGEVRVNKGRIKQGYRLTAGDCIRIPPIYQAATESRHPPCGLKRRLADAIIYEDADIMVLNKPAGIAVHGGSGHDYGVIEALRRADRAYAGLELVHRLDKDTSGCLLLAKHRPVLRRLHDLMRAGKITKIYLALLAGRLAKRQYRISNALQKNRLRSGERVVSVAEAGKPAMTRFIRQRVYQDSTLVRAELITGRTHQIRVHGAESGHPVIGDSKYGLRDINNLYRAKGLKRLFLHAESLAFCLSGNGKNLSVRAPPPADLSQVLAELDMERDKETLIKAEFPRGTGICRQNQ